MRYSLTAFGLGAAAFAVLELTRSLQFGLFFDMTLLIDALAFALATLLLAAVLKPLLRWGSGLKVLAVAPVFFILFAPVAGALAGVLELTLLGGWGAPDRIRSAFIAGPVNIAVDTMFGLWFVAVPLLLIVVAWLGATARAENRFGRAAW